MTVAEVKDSNTADEATKKKPMNGIKKFFKAIAKGIQNNRTYNHYRNYF